MVYSLGFTVDHLKIFVPGGARAKRRASTPGAPKILPTELPGSGGAEIRVLFPNTASFERPAV